MVSWPIHRRYRNSWPGGPIPAEWLDRLDGLAAGFAREAATYDDVQAALAAHPRAALTSTIASFPDGKPLEIALDRR